ncbi:MAG TPA: hypothetical protein VFU32_11520 [Ktedonobacterales bacterium]|nr:hypothetical protein [Ktedonobacterales bacterium]
MSEKPPKRVHWSVPILAFALGIPTGGALLIMLITLLLLNSTGTVHIGWSSVWAMVLSILCSAIVLCIVFVFGAIYSLRLIFRMVGGLLGDAFVASPQQGQSSGTNPLDEFLLRIARWGIPPGASETRQPGYTGRRGVVVDAAPSSSPEQEPTREPPGDTEHPPVI